MKKTLSFVLMAVALIGFFAGNILKGRYEVFSERFSTTTGSPRELTLNEDAAHTVFIWAVDEQTGYTWANVDAKISLHDAAGKELIAKQIQASESAEKGGIKRAQNGSDETLPAGLKVAYLSVEIIEGDYVDVEIHADLPVWLNLAPGLSILLGLVGLVLFIKARAATTP